MAAFREGAEDQDWAKVLDCEHVAIEARREWLKHQQSDAGKQKADDTRIRQAGAKPNVHKAKTGNFNTRGIALSGGGIRSAAFCLGALQALEIDGLFKKFDYISTVSGGGYIGTALTAAMSKNGGKFPFVDDQDKVSDTISVSHIRDFSNYLVPKGAIDLIRDLGIVFRGLAAIVMIVLPVLLLLAALTLYLNPSAVSLFIPPLQFKFFIDWPLFNHQFAWTQTMLLLSPLLFGVWAIWRSVQRATTGEFTGWAVNVAAFGMILFGFTAFLELQPVIISYFGSYLGKVDVQGPPRGNLVPVLQSTVDSLKGLAVAAGTFLATVSAFARKLVDVAKATEAETGWKANLANLGSKLALWLGALALPIFIWLVYLLLVYWAIPNLGGQIAPSWFSSSMCSLASGLGTG